MIGIIGESILAIAQFFNQGSLNGVLYFLGERTFTATTSGIANASVSGELILRPYGTFPHPNVLAGYLLISLTLLLLYAKSYLSKDRYPKFKNQKIFFGTALILGTVALFLNFGYLSFDR